MSGKRMAQRMGTEPRFMRNPADIFFKNIAHPPVGQGSAAVIQKNFFPLLGSLPGGNQQLRADLLQVLFQKTGGVFPCFWLKGSKIGKMEKVFKKPLTALSRF